jgi:hypothetical protein
LAIQLDGVDIVVVQRNGALRLFANGKFTKRIRSAINSVLKLFLMSLQEGDPAEGRRWYVCDESGSGWRKPFKDAGIVLDPTGSKERMQMRWDVMAKMFADDYDEEAAKLPEPAAKEAAPVSKKRTWVKGDDDDGPSSESSAASASAASAKKKMKTSAPPSSVTFLEALSERRGWEMPTFTKVDAEDGSGKVGFSVRLPALDEDLAPAEDHFSSDESEAKQAAAKAALARIRELQQAK